MLCRRRFAMSSLACLLQPASAAPNRIATTADSNRYFAERCITAPLQGIDSRLRREACRLVTFEIDPTPPLANAFRPPSSGPCDRHPQSSRLQLNLLRPENRYLRRLADKRSASREWRKYHVG